MKKPESVLFLCAHNDDNIIGGGGTIAKYAQEGKEVVTIIFSYGETSLPHLQEKIFQVTRVLESKSASKILGEKEVYYLALKEGSFKKEIVEKDIFSKIEVILDRIKPTKIFTHAQDDFHPDHRAIYEFTMELVKKTDYRGEVYSYVVWNPFINWKKRSLPRLVVDITETFHIKVNAFQKHKSQLPAIISLMWTVYLQAIMNGFNNHLKYAEVFYRIR